MRGKSPLRGEAIQFEIRPLDTAGVPTAAVLTAATLADLPTFLGGQQRLLHRDLRPPAPVSAGVGSALVLTLVDLGAGKAELHLDGGGR